MVGMARRAVPARVVAGGTNARAALGTRRSCAAARGADIAARFPYHATYIPVGRAVMLYIAHTNPRSVVSS